MQLAASIEFNVGQQGPETSTAIGRPITVLVAVSITDTVLLYRLVM